MPVTETEVTTGKVRNEIGGGSFNVGDLVDTLGLNKYSYYAPGQLDVDANKDITLTPPSVRFDLGEFRLYDHNPLTSFPPRPPTGYTLNWGLSYSDIDVTCVWFPGTMNYKAFAQPADYVMVKFYLTEANRTNEAAVWKSFKVPLSYVSAGTPLVGHSRQSSTKISSSGATVMTVTGFPVLGLATPDQDVWCEMYLCDVGENRKINFGTRAEGYFKLVLHRVAAPYAYGANNNKPVKPTGFTGLFPILGSSSAPCSSTTQLVQTAANTTYDIWVFAWGIFNDDVWDAGATPGTHTGSIALSNAEIYLTYKGVSQLLYSGALTTSGVHCTGTLAGGNAWSYDTNGMITFEAGTTIISNPTRFKCS